MNDITLNDYITCRICKSRQKANLATHTCRRCGFVYPEFWRLWIDDAPRALRVIEQKRNVCPLIYRKNWDAYINRWAVVLSPDL